MCFCVESYLNLNMNRINAIQTRLTENNEAVKQELLFNAACRVLFQNQKTLLVEGQFK